MRPIVTEGTVDTDTLAGILRPRQSLTVERADGDGRFSLVEGPFHSYARHVTYDDTGAGTFAVRQVVEADLAIPYWGWLFGIAIRRELAQLGEQSPGERNPWWAPPDRLDTRATLTLSGLALLSAVLGYATILLSQTITFAAHEFHVGTASQGLALAAVRADVLISFPVVAMTDRRGRRRVLLLASAGASIATAFGALAPNLPLLIVTQVPARGLLTAAALIITIMAAEEMPSGARAYAISLLAMAGALGGGVCVLLLPLADVGAGGWRILFVIALLGLFPLRGIARHLHETRRFNAPHPEVDLSGHGARLWLLAVSALLLNVFFVPASLFLNEYLRHERGFSGTHIALFTTITTIPGAIGVIAGGRLADVRGRRVVGSVSLVVGVATTLVMFVTMGWPMWAWSTLSTIVGAATVPALGVYGPELFPTSLRGRANAILGLVGRAGSVIGLIVVGVLSNHHSFGRAMTVVAIGPAILALLIVVAYPETARQSLEDLNPEDAGPQIPPPPS